MRINFKNILNFLVLFTVFIFSSSLSYGKSEILDSIKKEIGLQPNEYLVIIIQSTVQCTACTACTARYLVHYECLEKLQRKKSCYTF
jgi:hypothetical protein